MFLYLYLLPVSCLELFFHSCQVGTVNFKWVPSNARSLLTSTFNLPLEEAAISEASYNYNHYNLSFSHIMIIVIISNEDTLILNIALVLNMQGFCIYQGSEYTSAQNMPGYSIYQGFEYTGVTQASECAWILWMTPEYAGFCLNIPKC